MKDEGAAIVAVKVNNQYASLMDSITTDSVLESGAH
jgi:hypothetical protein